MQTAPQLDLSAIPAAQRAAVLALMEKVAALTEITQRQEHLIAELDHALHGKRSEKLTEDERQLVFEDLSIALAEVEVQKEHLADRSGDKTTTKPAPKRTIGNLPTALPRIEEVIEPESLICPCGCGVMHKIVKTAASGWISCQRSCASSSPCARNMPAGPAPTA
jgi:transposase